MSKETKICTVCDEVLPMARFHVNRARPDGRLAQCKGCRLAVQAKYRQSDRGRDAQRSAESRRVIGPKRRCRRAAAKRVEHAVAMGRIDSADSSPCEMEGPACDGQHQHHHDSYEEHRRLDVRCLCIRHHVQWHSENSPIYPEGLR